MKPNRPRYGLTSERARAWIAAMILPVIGSAISVHFTRFHSIPYALNFLAVAVIATVYGTTPSLIAVLSTIISRAVFLALAAEPPLRLADAVRISVLLAAGLLISLLTRSQRKAAAELQAAHTALQERTDALIESLHASKCASWYHDFSRNGNVRWYSGSFPVFGRPFGEIQHFDALLELVHPDDRPRLPDLIERMKTASDPILFEYRVSWPSGETHWLEMRATRVPGKAVVWRGVTLDITDRKLAESALLHSEKLAAMGRLASTVAHEINNPLESVTNLLYLARTDDTLRPATRSYLATAEQELARLGDITRLTLGFVRTSTTRSVVDVAEVVGEVLAIFRHRLETRSVQVERDFQPGVVVFMAAHELRQILTNLISNAVDALNGSGSRIAIQVAGNAETVSVVLEDNGTGIAASELPRIFDPFFTTKHDVGTGIGLWVTRELVESNRGQISAESGDLPNGMKTRFRIELPA